MANTYFDDLAFQTALIALICRDRRFLKAVAHILDPDDFKPLSSRDTVARMRWVIARVGLEYWQKYSEPIGDMLRVSLLEESHTLRMAEGQRMELMRTGRKIHERSLKGASSILDKVLRYKKEVLKARAVQELIDLQTAGELTDERWMEICSDAIAVNRTEEHPITEFFSDDQLEARILRRSHGDDKRYPLLYIEPLDRMVRAIGPEHLGLWMGPWKAGKSLALLWTALAYTLQRLNVLYFTLEDPMVETENRFDAAITALPVKTLRNDPAELRRRFAVFRRTVKGRLRIVDRVGSRTSVDDIKRIYLQEAEKGFCADAILVDYDDEIAPPRSHRERRFEFADIYRELRLLAGTYGLIVWTAAQTIRDTEDKKIIKAKMLAEDISKARKVMMAISIGQGEWTDTSKHLYVAAHKFDAQRIGCTIETDFERMIFYDHQRTRARGAEQRRQDKRSAL